MESKTYEIQNKIETVRFTDWLADGRRRWHPPAAFELAGLVASAELAAIAAAVAG